MNVCVLMGSPRKNGNTAALLNPICDELLAAGHAYEIIWLYDKKIAPCIACRVCQHDWTIFGCPIEDDVAEIFEKIIACDLIILATPIYAWYCTSTLKTLLDRLVYGMNKYYGDGEIEGPALWEGKSIALVTTCGRRPEHNADLWEIGTKRYSKRSKLNYLGMLVELDNGYNVTFMDNKKEQNARNFAKNIVKKL